jgi:CheY-like chemotaxis protein
VLRQDPDIIMVGEIRDNETAEIALQSAMTGHLVFSTLHTNDTIATITRLVDMGIERFKISPGLLAITAQRLVRRICPECREEVPSGAADPAVLAALEQHGFPRVYYRGLGCKTCGGTGYLGRTSIVELLVADARVKELINAGAIIEEIKKHALASGALRTMNKDALWHLSAGETDLSEIQPYLELNETPAPSPAIAKATPAPAPQPAVPAAPAAPPASPAPAPLSQGLPRVMIADDDATVRLLLRKFIGEGGYEVIEAVDGEAALLAIAAGPAPDLLISDINMPKMNGLDLVKGVRETLGILDMPVIMLTTESSDKSQELAFKLGADDYVMKPFKAQLVMARINAALRRAGKIK